MNHGIHPILNVHNHIGLWRDINIVLSVLAVFAIDKYRRIGLSLCFLVAFMVMLT